MYLLALELLERSRYEYEERSFFSVGTSFFNNEDYKIQNASSPQLHLDDKHRDSADDGTQRNTPPHRLQSIPVVGSTACFRPHPPLYDSLCVSKRFARNYTKRLIIKALVTFFHFSQDGYPAGFPGTHSGGIRYARYMT